jgi:hypothetical protein
MSLLGNIIAEAHMAGQSNAGCKHPSWGNACGYLSTISEETFKRAARQELEKPPKSELVESVDNKQSTPCKCKYLNKIADGIMECPNCKRRFMV